VNHRLFNHSVHLFRPGCAFDRRPRVCPRRGRGAHTTLELVDVDPPVDYFEEVVADNVYNRAFVLGLTQKVVSGTRLESTCRVNGEIRASGRPRRTSP
jgi:hypothetical protein